MESEYCYVMDLGYDAPKEFPVAHRYCVVTENEDFCLARFDNYNFATWFCDAVNAAYRLATQMDHD